MAKKFLVPLDLGNNRIQSLGTPNSDSDAATKAYVDAANLARDVKDSCRVATTADIALTGTPTIDGVSLVAGDRVLVKDQAAGEQNGIYVVAAGAWSRSIDADSGGDVTPGMYTFVEEGTVNADSGWVLTTNAPINLGVTSLTFVQFSGAGQVIAGAGLTKSGNTLNIGQGTGIQVNADDVALAIPVPIAYGGTGAITAAAARAGLGTLSVYDAVLGNGAATSYNIDHTLGTKVVGVAVWQESDGVEVECDVTRSTINRVVLGFSAAPATDSLHVMVWAKAV